ncbi:stage II sporulation protein M [Natronobiforma cellulositropha]|uniref:stage II sporulation protein M n=1 Tax=Natronobiforma cellulositropha TaxID=1679076 RepID=UPI0021D5FAC2|nr:stage II sporulation protein M [Natronobiforma cellulositropha]
MNDPLRGERAWPPFALVLAVVAVSSGVVGWYTADSAAVALGATVTAAALVAVGVRAPGALAAAWREHRPYVGFATGLFAAGAVFGVLLFLAGVDLVDVFLELLEEEFGPLEEGEPGDELALEVTAGFFIAQNTPPFLLSIFGAVTVGVLTLVIMVINGILVGNVVVSVGGDVGFAIVIASIVPHGIFELPALFVAAGVGFRLLHRFVQRVTGAREAFVTKSSLYRTGVFVCFAWLVLVLAAFVEAYVTLWLVDLLFGS